MSCDCKSKVEETIKRRLDEAKQISLEQKKKLDQFQEGIKEGANSLISRMIYELGVYATSLENNCSRSVTRESVQSTLDRKMTEDSRFSIFYSEHRPEIFKQGEIVDSNQILRPLTKKREKAPGLLQANIVRENENIKKSLERLEKLQKSLNTWKEGTRREQKVESILITDLHH